ncbi:MAG: hypothetical protein ACRECT_08685 [Thermoplasmata archaeon]
MIEPTSVRREMKLLRACGIPAGALSPRAIRARAAAIEKAVRAYEAGAGDRGAEKRVEKVWEAHLRAEFGQHDVDATMDTMVPDPHLIHLPTLAGGANGDEVRTFYSEHFLPKLPRDIRILPISRTVGAHRVVDEFYLEFTHDREVDFILPGVPPTGRRVTVPTVGIIGMSGARLAYEHIYWDQASVLVQVGLLRPEGLPVFGAEQSRRMRELVGGRHRSP